MRSSSFLEVNYSYLSENFNHLKSLVGKAEILFMVKANGYGHGMSEMAEYAYNNHGINSFGVASLGEAIALRTRLKDVFIYIFSDIDIENIAYEKDLKLIPVIAKEKDLKRYVDLKRCNPLALMINTGMNRLGFDWQETKELIKILKDNNLSVFHLMTHFSDSYLPKKAKTQTQYDRFKKIKKDFSDNGVEFKTTSVANSGAIENGVGLDETMVRPGLMVYGPQSTMGKSSWQGKVISSLRAEILQLLEVKKGDTVGYGSTVVPSDGVMAICALGYGDGLFNGYQKLPVTHNGVDGHFVGRVNMDMFQVLFPHASIESFSVGELISVWNGDSSNSLQKVSMHTKLIPYEVFCAVSSRVPRRYI